MGAVYEAVDQRLSRTVALKETLVETDDLRRAFEREAQLLANLRHPVLPKVIDHFREGEGLFLVMEFIQGADLGALLEQRGGPFPPADVLRWADQLLDALEYLHAHQPPILHRDIKPANLKLTAQGQIILLDFGLAKGAAGQMSTLTASRSILGYTPNYAPLEQIQGAGTDPRSDLYSLAAMLYHLSTGVKPPDALTRADSVVNGYPDPLRPAQEVNRQVPPLFSDALMTAMALNRNQRPQTAFEMRQGLHHTDPSLSVTAPRMDETETTKVRPPATNAGADLPATHRHQAPAQVVIPVPSGEPLTPLRRGRTGWMWILAGLLLVGLVSLFIARYALHPNSGVANRTQPTPPPVNENAGQVSNTNNQNITNGQPVLSPAMELAREQLAQKRIPYREDAFLKTLERGDVNTVKLFLAAGMNPNAKDEMGRTALMLAALNGHNHISHLLLDKGADVNARDDDGSTAIINAASNDHRGTLEGLLESGANVNAANKDGQTALLRAAKEGHTEIVRILLNKGAKVNVKDKDGRSALMWAEINAHSDTARLLKEAGATEP